MCEPISMSALAIAAAKAAAVSVAVNGAMNVATGQSFFAGAGQAALIGGVTGGIGSGISQVGMTAGSGVFNASLTQFAVNAGAYTPGLVGIGVSAAGGSLLRSMMPAIPDSTGYTPASYQVQQQQFNSQQIATTGSGGRQATASLAQAISRSKQRKLSQADVSDLSIDTSSFASTGLQFA